MGGSTAGLILGVGMGPGSWALPLSLDVHAPTLPRPVLLVTSIPLWLPLCSVFGGMTTFLFANVIASGVKIIVSVGAKWVGGGGGGGGRTVGLASPSPSLRNASLPLPAGLPACSTCLPLLPSRPPIAQVGQHLSRRNRIIMAFSFALGIGVTLVPQW